MNNEKAKPIEFLFNADLEVELHGNDDQSLGAHSGAVLDEMIKEAGCTGIYSSAAPISFILSNGDTDALFDKTFELQWRRLEANPCYHVLGNHEGAYFKNDGNKWKDYLGYKETYYTWTHPSPVCAVTFIALDTWCSEEEDGALKMHAGSGQQVVRNEEKQWLKNTLDDAPGLVVVFAHAHMWPPGTRSQDNQAIEDLIEILNGTYENGKVHKRANVFFNGGHHDYPGYSRLGGVLFIDPIAAVKKGYARVIIDPVNRKLDYIGRFNEKSYLGLDLD
jgi:hypothetical protein